MAKRGSNEWKKNISVGTKKAMKRKSVQAKIRKQRKPLSKKHRGKISRALEGKEPKNLFKEFHKSNKYHSKHGWIEIGGKRYYMKSIWERNYARYLQWLKEQGEIKEWEYECKIFYFHKISVGNRTFKPDFKVTENDGSYHWDEVKGWMDARSKTKLNRMARYYPKEEVNIIGKEEYYTLSKQVKNLVPEWEVDRNVWRDW